MVTGQTTPYIFPQAVLASTRTAQLDDEHFSSDTEVGPVPGTADVVQTSGDPAPALALEPGAAQPETALVNPPINDGNDLKTAQAWEQYAMKALVDMGTDRQFSPKDLRHINGVINDTAEALRTIMDQTTDSAVKDYAQQTLQNLTQASQIYNQIPNSQAVGSMQTQLYQRQTMLDQQNQNLQAQMRNSQRVSMAVAEVPMGMGGMPMGMGMPPMPGMPGMGMPGMGMPGMGMPGMGMPINVPPMPPGVATPYGMTPGYGGYPPAGYPSSMYPTAGYPGAPGGAYSSVPFPMTQPAQVPYVAPVAPYR